MSKVRGQLYTSIYDEHQDKIIDMIIRGYSYKQIADSLPGYTYGGLINYVHTRKLQKYRITAKCSMCKYYREVDKYDATGRVKLCTRYWRTLSGLRDTPPHFCEDKVHVD